jgi:Cu(I)/Ag(I) efflux system membrane protein CusA/SilA
MIDRIIEYSLRNKFLVIGLFLLIIGWGFWALQRTPIDAIPDIGENQQIVFVDWPGRSPKDIEDQIIYPLSVRLMGIPGTKVIRTNAMFSVGMINVIFEEDVDFYWSRTRILERLNLAQQDLPDGVVPQLGPDATALGQIFWYTVENSYYCPDHPRERFAEPGRCAIDGQELIRSHLDLGELRSIQDWYVRFQLNAAPGVSEVASVGGYVKQYQIDVDPRKLLASCSTQSRAATWTWAPRSSKRTAWSSWSAAWASSGPSRTSKTSSSAATTALRCMCGISAPSPRARISGAVPWIRKEPR